MKIYGNFFNKALCVILGIFGWAMLLFVTLGIFTDCISMEMTTNCLILMLLTLWVNLVRRAIVIIKLMRTEKDWLLF